MSDVIKGALIIGICIFLSTLGFAWFANRTIVGRYERIGIIFLIMLPAANTILAQINTAHSLSVGNSVGMAITTKKNQQLGTTITHQ